jgi:hypothetical protein
MADTIRLTGGELWNCFYSKQAVILHTFACEKPQAKSGGNAWLIA